MTTALSQRKIAFWSIARLASCSMRPRIESLDMGSFAGGKWHK
jgi:hypothetical protein